MFSNRMDNLPLDCVVLDSERREKMVNYSKGDWHKRGLLIVTHCAPYSHIIAELNHIGDKVEVDGHLIAAAPMLYEALKGILQVATPVNENSRYEFEKWYMGGFKFLGNRLDKAVEALAKAEGK